MGSSRSGKESVGHSFAVGCDSGSRLTVISLSSQVVIDGGKGQLASAIRGMAKAGIAPINSSVSDKIPALTKQRGSVAICAIAKSAEEVFIPSRSDPVNKSPDSPALLLLRSVRDESHRFAVAAHRNRRSIQKST